MTSKEALKDLYNIADYCLDEEEREAIKKEYDIVIKDLERLEELENAISILRWCIDIVKNDNGEYMILPKGNTSEEEYNLIKKVLM